MKAFLAAFALVALTTAPGWAADVTYLPDGRTMVVDAPAAAPRGIVLLIPGGDSQLSIGTAGDPRPSGNFVIRTRTMWLDAGFAIAYLNDPTDLREPIARLHALGRPVVVVSTSRGTIVAGQNSARLGAAGPDLVVLTSPVTSGGPAPSEVRPGMPASLAVVDLHTVSVPVLVVTNDGDSCRVSTTGGAVALAKRFTPPAQVLHVSSSAMTSAPCEAFSPHGYLGIEADVIHKIIDWIRAQPARN